MFDSHAHVSFYQFDDDREDIVRRARDAGLSGWLEVGTSFEQSRRAIDLAREYEGVYAAVGLHPNDIQDLSDPQNVDIDSLKEFKPLLLDDAVRAVGEVGFDSYRGGNPDQQEIVLRYFIDLALERDLPMVFHVRSSEHSDDHERLISLLRSYKTAPRGVIHTFSGNAAQAQEYLDLGLYLSCSGVVTFKNGKSMQDVAASMPFDRLLIETDCPFLAPEPYRGKRNEPSYVVCVADAIARLRNISTEEVREITEQNARTLFSLS